MSPRGTRSVAHPTSVYAWVDDERLGCISGGDNPSSICMWVDDERRGCVSGGENPSSVGEPKCRDAMTCDFKLMAQRGARVDGEIGDIDKMTNALIGRCNFTARKGARPAPGW